MGYAAVFFDVGGTMVHADPTFPDLFATILRREGHDVDPGTVHERAHIVFDRFGAAARTKEMWTTSPERSRRFWHEGYAILLKELGLPDGDGLLDAVYAAFTDPANYALYEDVAPALERLGNAGLSLGVVSNFEAWLDPLLERLGVRSTFGVRVISGIEGIEKPDPRIFELAMERAGVEPSASVYVGDDPELDVDPALALGMLPVLIDRRNRYPDATGARIASLSELPAVVGAAP